MQGSITKCCTPPQLCFGRAPFVGYGWCEPKHCDNLVVEVVRGMLLFRNAPSGSIGKAVGCMLDNKKKTKSGQGEPVVIKKYANRRLYNTESSTYVTLDDLAQMVRSDRDFVVYDAKSGDDLTHSVLTQIIVEQESRPGGGSLLPIPFLRQLIRFYDDSFGRMVPSYLQCSIEALAKEQDRYRQQFASAWGGNSLEAYQEQARKNLAMFEQAMEMWSPFKAMDLEQQSAPGHRGMENGAGSPTEASPEAEANPEPVSSKPVDDQKPPMSEIDALKAELAAMQHRIEKLSQDQN